MKTLKSFLLVNFFFIETLTFNIVNKHSLSYREDKKQEKDLNNCNKNKTERQISHIINDDNNDNNENDNKACLKEETQLKPKSKSQQDNVLSNILILNNNIIIEVDDDGEDSSLKEKKKINTFINTNLSASKYLGIF